MASAARNIFRETGTRSLSKARIANAKAMSVAMGMPQPCMVGLPPLKKP